MTSSSRALLALLIVALGAVPAASQTTPDTPARGVIEVSGTGVVQVTPDRARMSFAVVTEAPSAADASARNAELMDAVVGALRGLDADDLTVETFGYSLRPEYARFPAEPGRPRVISGYTAMNNIQVTLGDVEAVGSAMDVAIGAGANRVSGLVFEATDTEEAYQEALTQAVGRARREAETMATALRRSLGDPLEVRAGAEQPSPRQRGDFQYQTLSLEQAVVTPVEAGNLNVTASVFIRFALGDSISGDGR